MEPSVRLIPLGGLGEIGLNMMLVESGDDLIAVDCGLMFPDDELPGIDHVIPDFSYALAKRDGFRAVVLTHGHEDHIGALPYLLREARVPVYGTPLTLALAGERLREHGLLPAADLRPMRPRARFEVGAFTVEPIRVTHSIVDGIGLAIGTPVGTVVHTGDFKFDPSPLDGEPADIGRFAELGAEGVLVLCSDSTNVDRPGTTRPEVEVGRALAGRFQAAPGRIILATFASHVHRIQQVLDLTARHGRRAALLGMSMQRNVAIAAELGYLRVPAGVLLPLEDLAALREEHPNIVAVKEATGDLERMKKTRQLLRGEFTIMSGDDDKTLSMMLDGAIGAAGVVSVWSNVFPKAVSEMVAAARAGKAAPAKSILYNIFILICLYSSKALLWAGVAAFLGAGNVAKSFILALSSKFIFSFCSI